MSKQEFLQHIEDFLIETGLSPTMFGIQAIGDSKFVFSLRKGREVREALRGKVIDFIANYRTEKIEEGRDVDC